ANDLVGKPDAHIREALGNWFPVTHRANGDEKMKWSNLEMDVGVLAARWSKIETTYWNALRQSVDGLRQMMRLLNDRMEAVEHEADVWAKGMVRLRARTRRGAGAARSRRRG